MIVDLDRFIERERPYWTELRQVLERLDKNPEQELSLRDAERLHYLYQRSISGLGKLDSLPATSRVRIFLEGLIAEAHVQLHDSRRHALGLQPLDWFLRAFPAIFRRHLGAFGLAALVMFLGALLGAGVVAVDREAKEVLMPFAGLLGDPGERVAHEERAVADNAHQSAFASQLMSHNIRVGIAALALGLLWGIGTIIVLFYNGVILGAVCFDYIWAGHSAFLAGWLLPHGAVEIPSILIAGQAGLVLGRALVGWGDGTPLGDRLRHVRSDLVSLVAGFSILLVWAGIVEAFLSQYHEPTVPYWLKISFGVCELSALLALLLWPRESHDSVKLRKAHT